MKLRYPFEGLWKEYDPVNDLTIVWEIKATAEGKGEINSIFDADDWRWPVTMSENKLGSGTMLVARS